MQGIGRERCILCARLDAMKNVFAVWMAWSCVIGWAQVPDYVPTEGLVTWYSLDNGLSSALNTNLDLVATGGGFVVDRNGYEFGAYSFEGESSCQTSGDLPVSGTSSRSISFWARLETTADVIAISHGDQGTGNRFESGFNYGQQGIFVSGANSVVTYQELDSTFNWNHYVLVMEEGSSIAEVSLYQNGVLLETPLYVQNENVPVNTISTALFLGKGLNSSPGQGFIGALDDVGVWNRALTDDEVLVLFDAPSLPIGCVDEEACNYDSAAVIDDGTCHYNCLFCLDGTVWSDQLCGCVVVKSSDTDFDGCVGMTDLLDLLSVFGTCNEVPWSCGDPLEYQGYDYETVQIGEQCWFAENLRSQVMSNGDLLIENPSDSAWAALNVPAWSFFGDNPESMVNGLLYNGHAAMDERGICPSGWFTPSDEAWKELETHLGMTASEVDQDSWRGTNQGAQLKGSEQDSPSWDGLNEVDFGASPAGFRSSVNGESYDADVRGYFWTSSAYSSLSWFRMLESDNDQIRRTWSGREAGMSIRCVMSSE